MMSQFTEGMNMLAVQTCAESDAGTERWEKKYLFCYLNVSLCQKKDCIIKV